MANGGRRIPIQQLPPGALTSTGKIKSTLPPQRAQRQDVLGGLMQRAKAAAPGAVEYGKTFVPAAGRALMWGAETQAPASETGYGGLIPMGGRRMGAEELGSLFGAGLGQALRPVPYLTAEQYQAQQDYMLSSLRATGQLYPPQELGKVVAEQAYAKVEMEKLYQQLGLQKYTEEAAKQQLTNELQMAISRMSPEAVKEVIKELGLG